MNTFLLGPSSKKLKAKRKSQLTVAYPGFQQGGCLRSGPIRKVGGGGGGGGGSPLQVPYTKSGGEGQSTSGPIYEKCGGAVHFRSHIRKVGGGGAVTSGPSGGGGGGSPLQVRYLCLAHRK